MKRILFFSWVLFSILCLTAIYENTPCGLKLAFAETFYKTNNNWRIEDFAISPFDSKKIYCITYDKPSLFLRSGDAGITWENKTSGLPPGEYHCIHPSDTVDKTLFLGTSIGLFKSINDGDSWIKLFDGESIGIAVKGETIIANYQSGSNQPASKLYKSTDGGNTWRDMLPNGVYSGSGPTIDPTDLDVIYSYGYWCERKLSNEWYCIPYFIRTRDGGKTFDLIGFSAGSQIFGIAVDEKHPNNLLGATNTGIFFSNNQGTSWEKISGYYSTYTYDAAIFGNDIYGATEHNLIVSHDYGGTWGSISEGLKYGGRRIVIAEPFIYVSSVDGLYYSYLDPAEAENVSAPTFCNGPVNGMTSMQYSYETGGAISNFDHPLEYRFEWGDGSYSNWSSTLQTVKSWSSPMTYTVRCQARCAADNRLSDWSRGITVTISDPPETISTPTSLSGSTYGVINVDYSYKSNGSSSTLGHPIEYQFDWKGDDTDISTWGASSRSKNWTAHGTYHVKVMARCVNHPSVRSSWSPPLTVTISVPISLAGPSDQSRFSACSLYALPTFSWTGETFKSHEIQFSLDQSFISIPVKIKASANTNIISSNTWKKILSLPGPSGGTIYWRVLGTRGDKTTALSETRSVVIDSTQTVESPNFSPISKSAIPALSWQNNCNVKFKVYFGNDEIFTKKSTISFTVKNPMNSGGVFSKPLSSNQWASIRKLVSNETGSTIHWYVESWDALGRYTKTDVMSFVLID